MAKFDWSAKRRFPRRLSLFGRRVLLFFWRLYVLILQFHTRNPRSQPSHFDAASHFRPMCLAISRSSLYYRRAAKLETSGVGGAWLTRKIDSLASFLRNFAGSRPLPRSVPTSAISLFLDRKRRSWGETKSEEGRVPLSTVESSERQGKKLKANNGAKGKGVRGSGANRIRKRAVFYFSFSENLAPPSAVMKLRSASVVGGMSCSWGCYNTDKTDREDIGITVERKRKRTVKYYRPVTHRRSDESRYFRF